MNLNLEEMKASLNHSTEITKPAQITLKQASRIRITEEIEQFLATGGEIEIISGLTRSLAQSQMIASRQLYNTTEAQVIAKRARKQRARSYA